ncbi:kinase family protein [Dorcoceras hygrometricum]|uniref:Kinase family protein n=1 Tax=Dorcoceras hygrometricum TaxID=472368 RepID=A0A2Z7CQA1_9LAMI|nr:kinase family protein [Dorcoceras hygrometricum]
MALEEKIAKLVNQIREEKTGSGKRKPDQGSQQLDAYDGEAEGCFSEESNQLGRKPAEKPARRSDLLSVMNKLARSSSRVGMNRTRAAEFKSR